MTPRDFKAAKGAIRGIASAFGKRIKDVTPPDCMELFDTWQARWKTAFTSEDEQSEKDSLDALKRLYTALRERGVTTF